MTKSKKNIVPDSEIAFNNLPFLPPNKDKIETVKVLRQLVKSSVALAELKGIVHILPNPEILLNAVILKTKKACKKQAFNYGKIRSIVVILWTPPTFFRTLFLKISIKSVS